MAIVVRELTETGNAFKHGVLLGDEIQQVRTYIIHTYVHALYAVYTHTHTYIHIYIQTYAHTHTHTYTHTYIRTHTYVCHFSA